MLLKCPECGNEVSSQAASCPKCGHPVGPTAQPAQPVRPTEKKVSHSAGWIALAAFLFASFTPAILAPILVLVALIFAAKELSAGSKVLGGLVLALSLLQKWFVIDHFGHISGSLGLTTAEDTDRQTASNYASTSMQLPPEWRETVKSKCQGEWPTDYRMQDYCVKQQTEAASTLDQGQPSDIEAATFRVIRGKCAEEWPRDFKIRAYCEQQQLEGYRALQASTISASARNACAQQWPSDYKMRRYCETKNH